MGTKEDAESWRAFMRCLKDRGDDSGRKPLAFLSSLSLESNHCGRMKSCLARKPGRMGEKVGIRVGGYRLAEDIGMSAMDSLFPATVEVGGKSLPMTSVVAVDLIHPRLRTISEFLRRSHCEAKIAARRYQPGIDAGNKAIKDSADTPSEKGFSNLVAENTGRLKGVRGAGATGQEAERRRVLIHHKGLRLSMKQWQTFMDSDLHSKVAPSKNRPLCCPGLTLEIQLTDGSASALNCKLIGGCIGTSSASRRLRGTPL